MVSNTLADLVDWGMTAGRVYTDNSFSTIVPNGTLARFGTFGASYDFTGKSFAQLNADFTVWGTDTSMAGGQFYVHNTTTTGPDFTPWYIFIGSSPSSFGIFGNPDWYNSDDPLISPFVRAIDLSDPGTYAAGGYGFISGNDVALIPEPSTFALLALGSAAFVVMRKRRKS